MMLRNKSQPFIKTKNKKFCFALQLIKEGYKTVFVSRAVLDSVFERESACIFSSIRAGILDYSKIQVTGKLT